MLFLWNLSWKLLHFSDAAKRQENIIVFQWPHAHENKPKCTAAKKNPVCHTSYLFGFGKLNRAELREAWYTALSHHPTRPSSPRAPCRLVAKVRVGPTLTTSPLVHFFKEEDGVLTSSLQFHEVHFLFRLENKTKPASECTLSSVPGISSNFL